MSSGTGTGTGTGSGTHGGVGYAGQVKFGIPQIFLSGVGPFPGVYVGAAVTGPGVPLGAVVTLIQGSNLTISDNATASAVGTFTFI